jgi:hypothetical protein
MIIPKCLPSWNSSKHGCQKGDPPLRERRRKGNEEGKWVAIVNLSAGRAMEQTGKAKRDQEPCRLMQVGGRAKNGIAREGIIFT